MEVSPLEGGREKALGESRVGGSVASLKKSLVCVIT